MRGNYWIIVEKQAKQSTSHSLILQRFTHPQPIHSSSTHSLILDPFTHSRSIHSSSTHSHNLHSFTYSALIHSFITYFTHPPQFHEPIHSSSTHSLNLQPFTYSPLIHSFLTYSLILDQFNQPSLIHLFFTHSYGINIYLLIWYRESKYPCPYQLNNFDRVSISSLRFGQGKWVSL